MIGGFDMRSVEEISIDGLRRVVLSEVNSDNSKLDFFREGFCYLSVEIPENIFNLSKSKLRNRKYLNYAEKFLEEDFGTDTVSTIEKFINFGAKSNSRCSFTFNFPNSLQSIKGSGDPIKVSFNIGILKSFSYYYCSFKEYSILTLSQMSDKELFNLSGSWDIVDIDYSEIKDFADNCLCSFKYNNITYMGYRNVLENFNATKYLNKVDYLNTGKLFKENIFTREENLLITKAVCLKKNITILILYINEDASLVYKILD